MAVIRIPALMRELTGGREELEVALPESGGTVREVLSRLDAQYPGLAERLIWEGELMPGIAVFVDGEQSLLGLRQKVTDRNQLDFIPPAVGG